MYELTEEQKMLQQTVRQIAKEKVEPRAAEIDAKGEFSWEIADLLYQYLTGDTMSEQEPSKETLEKFPISFFLRRKNRSFLFLKIDRQI